MTGMRTNPKLRRWSYGSLCVPKTRPEGSSSPVTARLLPNKPVLRRSQPQHEPVYSGLKIGAKGCADG